MKVLFKLNETSDTIPDKGRLAIIRTSSLTGEPVADEYIFIEAVEENGERMSIYQPIVIRRSPGLPARAERRDGVPEEKVAESEEAKGKGAKESFLGKAKKFFRP